MIDNGLERKFNESFVCSRILRKDFAGHGIPSIPDWIQVTLSEKESKDWELTASNVKDGNTCGIIVLASGMGGTRLLAQNAGWPVFQFWVSRFQAANDPLDLWVFLAGKDLIGYAPGVVDVLT